MQTITITSLACCLFCYLLFELPTGTGLSDSAGFNSNSSSTSSINAAGNSCERQQESSIKYSSNHIDRKIGLTEFNQKIFQPEHFDRIDSFMYAAKSYHGRRSVSTLLRDGLLAKVHAVAYAELFSHRYENFADLRASGGPQADQELCLRQLGQLVVRADKLSAEQDSSRDVNMMLYLDTFGRVPAGVLDGDATWLGSYGQCTRLELLLEGGAKSAARYCMASLKMRGWPENKLLDEFIVFRLGVCLPKACDSMKHVNKYQLIKQLVDFNARKFDLGLMNLSNLYCLPDEQSSLRIWWHSPGTVVAVCLLASWLLLLLYATIKHQRLLNAISNRRKEEQSERVDGEQVVAASENSNFGLKQPIKAKQFANLKFYESLSIIYNFEALFSTSSEASSSIMKNVNDKQADEKIDQASGGSEGPKIVDLRVIEGVKVICSAYIIMAHVMMLSTIVMKNGREMTVDFTISSLVFNLAPAFAVNAFFTITGLLTSYLLFKQNQSTPMLTSPAKWLGLTLYRYLRIMPIYLIVILYAKYLAKYAGAGPLWDYGTSSLSHRRICEQESWLWVLLFGANFKPPLEHCISSAWYLANDFQFALVTPIFLSCLHKYPKFGQRFIKLCIAGGYVAGFINIYSAALPDLRPIARFAPYAFKTFITFLNEGYTQPQYRIPAYLIGLLLGYWLHNFETSKLKLMQYQQQQRQDENITKKSKLNYLAEQSDWSVWFRQNGSKCSIFFILLSCLTPFIASQIPFSRRAARIAVAFILPTYHISFSASIGLLLLLSATGNGSKLINKLLALPIWKPLARLSLCVLLINIEVIMFITQSNTQSQQLDFQYHASLNIYCILVTYSMATLTCVLFEAPLRALLNKAVASSISNITKSGMSFQGGTFIGSLPMIVVSLLAIYKRNSNSVKHRPT